MIVPQKGSNMLINADCLDALKEMKDNSIDSIVTDPPYGLSFMGKKRDYDVPSIAIREECLRVLKPGGHLLAFAGTRTQHRMAVNIEDAGFEIRDMIAWVYGSGFPKSHNIGKAIDKRGGNALLTEEIGEVLKKAREKRGITKSDADKKYCGGTTNWRWFEGRVDGQRIPPTEILITIAKDWEELRPYIKLVKKAEREVIGNHPSIKGNGSVFNVPFQNGTPVITAPATEEAKQREGRGTALKPALEPITVARKPLGEKTIAKNVLKYGTGGINIDECRVGVEEKDLEANTQGRFPANFIHDGSDEVVELFPETKANDSKRNRKVKGSFGMPNDATPEYNDKGSAARYFYQAKASKKERNKGLEGFEKTTTTDGRKKDIDNAFQRGKTKRSNFHPTVKPVKLMQYLVRLVTPKGGTCLDPFMGSGTTGIACKLEGVDFVGIEREEEYIEIAKARIEAREPEEEEDDRQQSLFY